MRPLSLRREAAAVHRVDVSYPERIEGAHCLCRPYATKQRLSCDALAACIRSRHLLNANCPNIAGNQYVTEVPAMAATIATWQRVRHCRGRGAALPPVLRPDRKSTRLNSSH